MTDSSKSALQVLKELRQERDELNALIQALERRLGISSATAEIRVDEESQEVGGSSQLSGIPVGFFHNLSQAAAAEKLLRIHPQQPLTTSEILQTLRASGMELNSKNALTIVYTALKRSSKFERVGSKAWGLREWYPEKKKKISREPEPDTSGEES